MTGTGAVWYMVISLRYQCLQSLYYKHVKIDTRISLHKSAQVMSSSAMNLKIKVKRRIIADNQV